MLNTNHIQPSEPTHAARTGRLKKIKNPTREFFRTIFGSYVREAQPAGLTIKAARAARLSQKAKVIGPTAIRQKAEVLSTAHPGGADGYACKSGGKWNAGNEGLDSEFPLLWWE